MIFKKRYFVIIGLILLAVILFTIDLKKTVSIILSSNPFYLLPVLFFTALAVIGKGLKWKQIISAQGSSISLSDSTRIFCSGFFLSILTPGRIGDLARAFYLKDKMPLGAAISTIVIDRIIDVVVLLSLSAFSIIALTYFFGITFISLELLLFLLILFIIFCALFFNRGIVRFLLKPFYKILVPEKFKKKLKLSFSSFYNSLVLIFSRKKPVASAVLIAFITWLFSILIGYFISCSLGLNVPFYFFVLLIPVLSLIEVIPISISGFGTREATAIFLLSVYQISAEQAVAFSLTYFFFAYLLVASLGAFFFLLKPISLSPLSGGA